MQSRLATDSTGRCSDSERIAADARTLGLEIATSAEIFQLRHVAAALFDEPIASAEVFDSVNRLTGASVFGYRPGGELQGMYATIPLRSEGVCRLKEGLFDGLHVDLDLVARAGEAPAAHYLWGWAAVNSRVARELVIAFHELRRALFWALPIYARLTADAGARVAKRMEYLPCPDARDPTLSMCAAFPSYEAAAL